MYYILQKNEETGKFEAWSKDGKIDSMDEKEVLQSFTQAVRLRGMLNVYLVKDVAVKIEVNVNIEK